MERTYIAIDLKAFYASVECVQHGLDPLTTNLVVADESRTDKTICLAISPPLKTYGLGGRARLFEVVQTVRDANARRRLHAPGGTFTGSSADANALRRDPALSIDYIVAPPRMAYYMRCSSDIYNIYLQYIAPEDIHVYSIDEVFIDATPYLKTYGLTARELAMKLILEVLRKTGITATAGIGPNLYLCKVAMDIEAKHIEPDKNGVRIAELDELTYRQRLWTHRKLTDFWRVGPGIAKKLQAHGMYTMGDVARCSIGGPGDLLNEQLLYRLFGVNAELLIDHAWGWEPCTIADIKAYKPACNSLGSGQVLPRPYNADETRLIVREMADLLTLDLVEKRLVTDQIELMLGYDTDNLRTPAQQKNYRGATITDPQGHLLPKPAHAAVTLPAYTSSTQELLSAFTALYDRIADPKLLVRRVNLVANRVLPEQDAPQPTACEQLDLFGESEARRQQRQQQETQRQRERSIQQALLGIKNKYGKNAILRGMNLQESATAITRNASIGGHKA
ncbi:MAG: DNA methylase [Candidatus Spyradocola sp.]